MSTMVGKFVWHEHASSDQGYAQQFYGRLLGWEFEVMNLGDSGYPMISAGG